MAFLLLKNEVADLRAAGLNPILSATGGNGASTGSVGANSAMGFGAPTGIDQLLNLANNSAMLDKTKAETANIRQNTSKQTAETRHEFEKISETIANRENLLSNAELSRAQRKKVLADIDFLKDQKDLLRSEVMLNKANATSALASADMFGSQSKLNASQKERVDFDLGKDKGHPIMYNYNRYFSGVGSAAGALLGGTAGFFAGRGIPRASSIRGRY